jgi:hypothetical protein
MLRDQRKKAGKEIMMMKVKKMKTIPAKKKKTRRLCRNWEASCSLVVEEAASDESL